MCHVPQLAEHISLEGIPPLAKEGQPSLPPSMNGPLDPAQAVLPREADGGGQGRGEGDAESFQLGWGTNPVKRSGHTARPATEAKDSCLVRPVEDCPRHLLKLPADGYTHCTSRLSIHTYIYCTDVHI